MHASAAAERSIPHFASHRLAVPFVSVVSFLLPGYARVVFMILAFSVCFTRPLTAAVCYCISQGLDAVDGQVARHFKQCSKFGAVLDMLTDRYDTQEQREAKQRAADRDFSAILGRRTGGISCAGISSDFCSALRMLPSCPVRCMRGQREPVVQHGATLRISPDANPNTGNRRCTSRPRNLVDQLD